MLSIGRRYSGCSILCEKLLILFWALGLFIVYLIIELLKKLLEGSFGFEELVIGLLIANLGYSFYINAQLSEHLGWHKGKDG